MITIDGKILACPHCGGQSFTKESALLNTMGMTFLDLEWLNKSADVYICQQCGRIEWFLPIPASQRDDKQEETTCMACGATIPPGKDTCPTCSWSYK